MLTVAISSTRRLYHLRRQTQTTRQAEWQFKIQKNDEWTAGQINYSMSRNNASGPEIGLAGWPILVLSRGSPAKIRPGRPTYGPEALLRDIEYALVQATRGDPDDFDESAIFGCIRPWMLPNPIHSLVWGHGCHQTL